MLQYEITQSKYIPKCKLLQHRFQGNKMNNYQLSVSGVYGSGSGDNFT